MGGDSGGGFPVTSEPLDVLETSPVEAFSEVPVETLPPDSSDTSGEMIGFCFAALLVQIGLLLALICAVGIKRK